MLFKSIEPPGWGHANKTEHPVVDRPMRTPLKPATEFAVLSHSHGGYLYLKLDFFYAVVE
jgi:hypothetical protein